MSALTSVSLSGTFLSFWVLVSSSYVQVNKTAEPGDTVTLPCRAPSSTNIIVVEWSRPELETEYVFMFRDGRSVPEHQHPSFQNRVDLNDRQMKDGDVSIKLKNVTSNDTGTYECRVFQRRTNHRKRANLKTERISTIYLDVHQSGHTAGHDEGGGNKDGGETGGNSRERFGLVAGFSVFVAVGFVGFISWIVVKHKRRMKKNAHQAPPAELAGDGWCET
ncbi:uncharacterized protein LOC111236655 [Seriola dumerili]|uniref:uncharacterized protein LOC111236655 n=1 Tax=Seriola dumerili TaxID=41447 RepID=UPI000BBE1C35|nr:uncharacterized protein LOC111236655 [Seriola dumerili]